MDAAQIVKMSAGPAIATDAGNRITSLNRAARELLGLETRTARGRSLYKLVRAKDSFGNWLTDRQFAFLDMVTHSEAVRSFDIEIRDATDRPLRVSVAVIVVLEQADGEYSVVYQMRPIYRRRKADEAIERLLAQRGTEEEHPLALRKNAGSSEATQLTSRQVDVLRLMARGAHAEEMASALGISVNTVRTHIQRILRRLGVHSQLEAVAVAFRERLI